jgi:hypothetical protein
MNKMELEENKQDLHMHGIVISHNFNNDAPENYDKKSKREKSDQIEIKTRNELDGNNSKLNKNPNNQRKIISPMEINEESDNDLQVVEKFEVPSSLKKTFIFTMILAVMGLTLFILGFIQDVAAADPGKGITFWVLGGIVMIPGGYYSYQFYKAKKARNMDERDEILEKIPEL